MNQFQNVNTYQANEVQTANRLDILVMLYDGAVRFMNQALKCLENKDTPGKGLNISKALAIINEFKNTLSYEHDPKLAGELDRLYDFVQEKLIYANIHNDPTSVKDALSVTEILRDGWKQIKQQQQGNVVQEAKMTNDNNYFRISV